MSSEESPATEEQFATWLAACEDALAAGLQPLLPDEAELPPGVRPQMEKALAGLRLLHQLRSRPGPEDTPPPAPPKVGSDSNPRAELPWTQLGRFELRRELGRGGFGLVFLAYDTLLRREVAVKVPWAETLVTPELRERFQREARAAAALEHPNLVPVYEAGQIGPVCFIVAAYCPGPTLAAWLREQTEPVPWRDAATLLATLADAVHYAHRHGVVHRDLKPANILLQNAFTAEDAEERRGRQKADSPPRSSASSAVRNFIPKITDFGLGKQITEPRAEGEATLTPSGTILGTIAYMAPEQTAGRKGASDPAVDIHALGAILYELLTGRPPFAGESEVDTLLQLRTQEPIPPHRLRPRLPRDLETICLKCLQKDPGKRYASCEALAEDLRRFLAGRAIVARPVGPLERLGRWARRNPYLAAANVFAGAAVLALLGLALAFALYQRNAARDLANQVNLTEHRSALLALDKGFALCQQGQVPEGMLWLAQSLAIADKLASADAADLRWVIRANLANWYFELRPLRMLLPQSSGFKRAAFSSNGRTLVTDSGGTIQRWETHTGDLIGQALTPDIFGGPTWLLSDVKAFAFSKAVNGRLWDLTTGRPLGPLFAHSSGVISATLSPDGRTFLAGNADKTARLWDAATGQPLGPPLEHQGAVSAVAFSPDGRTILTGCADGTAQLWDAATRKRLGPPLQHRGNVPSVAFSPDGRTVLTGSDDRTARLWDVATGKPVGRPLEHTDYVGAVAFSPDGRLVLTADRMARLWEAATGKPVGHPLRHQNAVSVAAFHPDGRTVLTGCWQEPARMWEVGSSRLLVPPLPHPDEVRAVAISRDGRTVLTGCKDGIARFWATATGKPLGPTPPPSGQSLGPGL